MNINLYGMLFLGIICIILYLEILSLKNNIKNIENKEQFTVSDEIKQTVMNTVDQVYNMDTEAIRNLGAISKSILTGKNYHNVSGTVTPGDLTIPANTTIDGDTTINGDTTITGDTNIDGNLSVQNLNTRGLIVKRLKFPLLNGNNRVNITGSGTFTKFMEFDLDLIERTSLDLDLHITGRNDASSWSGFWIMGILQVPNGKDRNDNLTFDTSTTYDSDIGSEHANGLVILNTGYDTVMSSSGATIEKTNYRMTIPTNFVPTSDSDTAQVKIQFFARPYGNVAGGGIGRTDTGMRGTNRHFFQEYKQKSDSGSTNDLNQKNYYDKIFNFNRTTTVTQAQTTTTSTQAPVSMDVKLNSLQFYISGSAQACTVDYISNGINDNFTLDELQNQPSNQILSDGNVTIDGEKYVEP